MGPPSQVSAAPSICGSGSSDWGREYEDEDTWYEFSSAYQTGPDAHLLPKRDTGLSLRMAQYRRTSGGGSSSFAKPMGAPSFRSSMKERRDLRDLEKEMEEETMPMEPVLPKRKGVWQLRRLADSDEPAEGIGPGPCQGCHGRDVCAQHVCQQCQPLTATKLHGVNCLCKQVLSECLNDNKLRDTSVKSEPDWVRCSKQRSSSRYGVTNSETLNSCCGGEHKMTDLDKSCKGRYSAAMTMSFHFTEDNSIRGLESPPPTDIPAKSDENKNTIPKLDLSGNEGSVEPGSLMESPAGEQKTLKKPTSLPKLAGLTDILLSKKTQGTARRRSSEFIPPKLSEFDTGTPSSKPTENSQGKVTSFSSIVTGLGGQKRRTSLDTKRRFSVGGIASIPENKAMANDPLEFLVELPVTKKMFKSLQARKFTNHTYVSCFCIGYIGGTTLAILLMLFIMIANRIV